MKKKSVVTCFLKHAGKMLLLKRSAKVQTYKGHWAGISGYLKHNENPLDRAEREVEEETGLMPPDVFVLRDGRPLTVKDNNKQWLVHPFLFEVRSPQLITLDWEHTKCEWISLKDIQKYKCVPGIYEAFSRVDLPEKAAKKIETIRADKSSGSVELAKIAVDTLLLAGNSITTKSTEKFFETLYDVVWHLIRVRPNMAPIQNDICTILTNLKNKYTSTSSVQVLRRALKLQVNKFRSAQKKAKENLQKHALKTLDKYNIILTHSYSSSVVNILTRWAKPNRHLFVTESRPLYEGHTVARLLSRKCQVTLITEAQVGYVMPEINAVIVGADSILADGSVINKMGTSMVALAAKDQKKPFYVIADTSKFHPGSVIGMEIPVEKHDPSEVFAQHSAHVNVSNIYFDATPARLVTGFLSEKGFTKGSLIKSHVQKSGNLLKILEDIGNYCTKKA